MFDLTKADLKRRILGCGDGPASFNADATHRNGQIVSVDPIYRFSQSQIRARIQETYAEILEQTRQHQSAFVWQRFSSVEELGRSRLASMERFLKDYPAGQRCGRYVAAELPCLPFNDQAFDLAICSHLLFLYTEQLSQGFHVDSILEMGRVAREVRVFPLLALNGVKSRHLAPTIRALERHDYQVTIEAVDYEFQRGGNQMMRICKR